MVLDLHHPQMRIFGVNRGVDWPDHGRAPLKLANQPPIIHRFCHFSGIGRNLGHVTPLEANFGRRTSSRHALERQDCVKMAARQALFRDLEPLESLLRIVGTSGSVGREQSVILGLIRLSVRPGRISRLCLSSRLQPSLALDYHVPKELVFR